MDATNINASQNWWQELGTLDPLWRLVPCDGAKRPVDPTTGRPLADWVNKSISASEFQKLPRQNVRAAGLVLGPVSGGVLAVDFDAEGYQEQFEQIFGRSLTDLPPTVAWTSGRPGRQQKAYRVDQKYWNGLRGKKAWKNKADKTCFELRWSGQQSVILGIHPETGRYHWCLGCSPQEVEVAEAPEWLLRPLMHGRNDAKLIKRDLTVEENRNHARRLLQSVSPRDDYDGWLKVGMSLHSADPSLLDDWIEWSKGSSSFDEKECIEKWSSFKNSGITLGTLYYLARQDGNDAIDRVNEHVAPSASNASSPGSAKWGDVLARMLLAIKEGDQDLEMDLRASIMSTYRRTDQQVDAALFKLHTKNIAGIKTRKKRSGLDLSRIKASEWLIPGFVIKNDLTLIYGNAGSGKTTVALGLANALLQGKGFLDHQIQTTLGRVLFIASDSGAQPLLSALQDMNMIDLPEYQEGAEKRFYVWAAEPDQEMLNWDISLANCIELQSFVVNAKIDLVIIDSCKAVFSSAGIDYADNNLVTAVLTYFKQVICASTSVIFINHDGREKGAAAGAKAWKEIPSIVHQIKRPDEKKNEGVKSFREWTCVKNRLGTERQFYYRLDDGLLAVTQATDVVGNCIDEIVRCLRDSPEGQLHLNDFCQRLSPMFSLGTIKNTLTSAVNGSRPRLRRVPNRRGFYRLINVEPCG